MLWNEGVFDLTHNYLESLLKAANEDFDYAILVFRADDHVTSRGSTSPATRGNVIFELGLFLGALGSDRTFIVYDTHERPSVISDLEGISFAPFDSSKESDILAAVGPACFLIRQKLKSRLGGYQPSRVLFLGANPRSTAQIGLDREVRAINDGLRQLQTKGRVSLVQQWALRHDEIDKVLQEHNPHFVHIACHGSKEGLVLEDSSGEATRVPFDAIIAVFKLFSDTVRCVFFTCDFVHSAAEQLANAVGCVISPEGTVTDDAVITFTTAFYSALGVGQDVHRSFELASTRLAATKEAAKFRLHAGSSPANELTL